jgi:hypothetical protein
VIQVEYLNFVHFAGIDQLLNEWGEGQIALTDDANYSTSESRPNERRPQAVPEEEVFDHCPG